MDKFLNKKVNILVGISELTQYTGLVTSIDDIFLCLDNEIYISISQIRTITLK